MTHLSVGRISIRAGLVALAAVSLLRAAPAEAGLFIPPPPTGSVTFGGFHDASGAYVDAICNRTFTPTGGRVCTGPVLGNNNVVTGLASGSGTVSGGAAGNAPVVTTHLAVSGGAVGIGGAGGNIVETVARYFVWLGVIAPPPAPTTTVPLIFTDDGSVTGAATSNEFVSGEASTSVFGRNGTLNGAFFDHVATSALGGPMSATYGNSHSVGFVLANDPDDDPVAQIDLDTVCIFQSHIVAFGTGQCDATADPFVGFDQTAFDTLMGANTYFLADFFEIIISPGFEPETPPAVPEPGTLALLATGIAALGALRRADRRRPRAAHPDRN
jgi:hypothetical protein